MRALLALLVLTGTPASAQLWEECNARDSFLGQAPGDQYGFVGVNAGDVDGDGKDDVVIGAPGNGAGGAGAGRAYVYSGATGLELFRFTGSAGESVGFAVAGAGDVNDDGFADVILGAPGGAAAAGRAYVVLGPGGQLALTLIGEQNGDRFGAAVDGAGDVDGDGQVDLLVGAVSDGTAAPGAGKAYVLSGADGAVLREALGQAAGDQFGSGVARLADRDGDGFADYAVGAPNGGPGNRGRAYVFTGVDGSLVTTLGGDPTSVNFGEFFLGLCGDVSGDGHADLFVSDFNNSALGSSTGRAFVYSGLDLAPLLVLTGEAAGHGFGIGRGWLGDWDGDGRDDLLFGSWLQGSTNAGRGEVRSGIDGRILAHFTGSIAGANLGFDAAGLGDLDGDGVPDLVLTAASQGGSRGAAHIVSGAPRPPTSFCEGSPNSAGPGASLGYRLSTGVSDNTFRLRVSGAPPGKLGLFYYGAGELDVPFGDGKRCIAAPTYRLFPPLSVNAAGTGLFSVDFTRGNPAAGPGQIAAGSTWSFQFWYRDPDGPGGSGFNLSDGLRVTFCP